LWCTPSIINPRILNNNNNNGFSFKENEILRNNKIIMKRTTKHSPWKALAHINQNAADWFSHHVQYESNNTGIKLLYK